MRRYRSSGLCTEIVRETKFGRGRRYSGVSQLGGREEYGAKIFVGKAKVEREIESTNCDRSRAGRASQDFFTYYYLGMNMHIYIAFPLIVIYNLFISILNYKKIKFLILFFAYTIKKKKKKSRLQLRL